MADPEHFLHAISRVEFEQQFGKGFQQPDYFIRFIAVLGNLLPNVGPVVWRQLFLPAYYLM